MKVYHMIIARPASEILDDLSTRREYLSTRQGAAPAGWICVGVCGYHETTGAGRSAGPEEGRRARRA